jgi:hypothetical protein
MSVTAMLLGTPRGDDPDGQRAKGLARTEGATRRTPSPAPRPKQVLDPLETDPGRVGRPAGASAPTRASPETPIERGSVTAVRFDEPSAGTNRVSERRRAVALAHHYREFEGLSIRQIANRLGRSPATIKAYFYDPSDANKGPSWELEAEPEGRELRSHLPAAASRGDVLPRRAFFALEWAVQHVR